MRSSPPSATVGGGRWSRKTVPASRREVQWAKPVPDSTCRASGRPSRYRRGGSSSFTPRGTSLRLCGRPTALWASFTRRQDAMESRQQVYDTLTRARLDPRPDANVAVLGVGHERARGSSDVPVALLLSRSCLAIIPAGLGPPPLGRALRRRWVPAEHFQVTGSSQQQLHYRPHPVREDEEPARRCGVRKLKGVVSRRLSTWTAR